MPSHNTPCPDDDARTLEGVGRASGRVQAAAGSPRRGRGRPAEWGPERIEREARAIMEGRERFPTKRELEQMGRGDLSGAMQRHGGFSRWVRRFESELGVGERRALVSVFGVADDVRKVIARLGAFPGTDRLREEGYATLAYVVMTTQGGRAAVLAELGYSGQQIQRLLRPLPRRGKWSRPVIERELRQLLVGLDSWPADSYFRKRGRENLLSAVRRHGGRELWARRLGLPYGRGS